MSNTAASGRSTTARDDCFRSLADATRRALLRLVYEQSPDGIAKDDLIRELAAVTADKSVDDVTDAEYQRAAVACQHTHLPMLLEAGLLAEAENTDTDDTLIVTTDHWAFDEPALENVITGRLDAPAAELDTLFEAVADSRRRLVLSVLAGNARAESDAMDRETLARAVAAREADTDADDVSQDRVATVYSSLVHVHLPLLEDAGLVDTVSDGVAYDGHPELHVSWIGDDAIEAGADGTALAEIDIQIRSEFTITVAAEQSLHE
ncbi:DUF7344 domain-containing protein [Halopiger aswanensis]|uniref:DUF7344 domain-containing protein n=1 Tax=Halopiger aswanensis TaxID=148449 RepID=A0A3R7E0I7_9EURY|nr:hypothetical protein [Halopiger aswanensis]RKD97091.1 hypothetical protein ATJ93_0072 [Halopiger aswanensis]